MLMEGEIECEYWSTSRTRHPYTHVGFNLPTMWRRVTPYRGFLSPFLLERVPSYNSYGVVDEIYFNIYRVPSWYIYIYVHLFQFIEPTNRLLPF